MEKILHGITFFPSPSGRECTVGHGAMLEDGINNFWLIVFHLSLPNRNGPKGLE